VTTRPPRTHVISSGLLISVTLRYMFATAASCRRKERIGGCSYQIVKEVDAARRRLHARHIPALQPLTDHQAPHLDVQPASRR
jgi:hypothetical protein